MIPTNVRILLRLAIASAQVVISSPAPAPTMVAPRTFPRRSVTTLMCPTRCAFGLGAVVLVIGPPQHPDGGPARPRLRLGQADLSEFGIGEGHARDGVRVHRRRQAEQRVADDEPGLVVGEVGELPMAGDVADGIDAPVAWS